MAIDIRVNAQRLGSGGGGQAWNPYPEPGEVYYPHKPVSVVLTIGQCLIAVAALSTYTNSWAWVDEYEGGVVVPFPIPVMVNDARETFFLLVEALSVAGGV